MELKSMRKEDSQQEAILNDFLLENFFQKMNPSARLVSDKETQIAGADIQQDTRDGKTVNIDIKAQSSAKYINNPRPTFVLELSSLSKWNEPFIGWFLNPDLITDYYTFVWVLEADVDEKGHIHDKSDVHKVEVMTVHKARLKEYIMSLLDEDELDSTIRYMRDAEETYQPLTRGVHFSHTPTLWEKPVNLVVHKNVLKQFAVSHRIVTPDGMTVIGKNRYHR